MMNTSSNTKDSLKINKLVTDAPYRTLAASAKAVLMTIATVSLLLLLVKLGFWQLDRANEKERLHAELILRQSQAPLTYAQLLTHDTNQYLTGSQLTLWAQPIANKLILLDNQVFEGQVGYLAYQLLQVPEQDTQLLLELGFVKAPKNRTQLPAVRLLKYGQNFSGRLYKKSTNPMSPSLLPEKGWPLRIQNLDITQLADYLGTPFAIAALQVEDLDNSLPHPWQPIPMSAQKHRGYALQWFSLALALFTLLFLLFKRQQREKRLTTSTTPVVNQQFTSPSSSKNTEEQQ